MLPTSGSSPSSTSGLAARRARRAAGGAGAGRAPRRGRAGRAGRSVRAAVEDPPSRHERARAAAAAGAGRRVHVDRRRRCVVRRSPTSRSTRSAPSARLARACRTASSCRRSPSRSRPSQARRRRATSPRAGRARRAKACDVRGPDILNSCELAERGPVVLAFFATRSKRCDATRSTCSTACAGASPTSAFAADRGARRPRATCAPLVRKHGWRLPVGYDHDGAVTNALRGRDLPDDHVRATRRQGGGHVARPLRTRRR